MKLSTILSLVPLAAALPGSRAPKDPNGAFSVTAARSGSPIHFLPLTASGGHFWLGGKSETYTPDGVPHTGKQTNDTILSGQHFLVRHSTLYPCPRRPRDTDRVTRTSSSQAANASTSTPPAP